MNVQDLVRRAGLLLEEQKLMIFLGAGASLGTDGEQGIPSTNGLRDALATRYDLQIRDDSTLRTIADLAVTESDEAEVKGFVASEIRSSCAAPLRSHVALARIKPILIMTTNYDHFIEQAFKEQGECPFVVQRKEQLPNLLPTGPNIFKLHGDISTPEKMVLTSADYADWEVREEAIITQVVASLQTNVCLFVGYGLKDENLTRLLRLVHARLGNFARRHYALVYDSNREFEAGWGTLVRFVSGDATEFLENLAERWRAENPPHIDLLTQRHDFAESIQRGAFQEATALCEQMEEVLRRENAPREAAALWTDLAEAAEGANRTRVAAVAYARAGRLLLEV